MLRIEMNQKQAKKKLCNQVSRRDAIRIGTTGLISGLSLPSILSHEALGQTHKPKAKSTYRIVRSTAQVAAMIKERVHVKDLCH